MNEKWDGGERREMDRDHDVLTRIDANLSNFMSRFEDHVKDDKDNFTRLYSKTSALQRIVYVASGVFLAIEFYLKYSK